MIMDFMERSALRAPDAGGDGGGAPASPGLDAAVDSLLAAPSPAESSPAASDEGGAAATPEPAPGAAPEAGEAAPAGDAPASDAGEEAQPSAEDENILEEEQPDDDLDQAMEDAAKPQNLLDLKQPRGKRIYGAYKAYKELTENLGFEPTVETAVQHYQAFSDKTAMEAEFASGDPAQAANFALHWNNFSPQGMSGFAAQLPDVLAKSGNTQAYTALAMPVLSRYVNALYGRAQAEANPELKEALLYTARMAEWDLTGKFRDGAAGPQGAPGPQDQREQALNSRWQEIQNWERGQQDAQRQQYAGGVQQANTDALASAVDKALAPLQKVQTPRLFNAAKRDFADVVLEHLSKDAEAQRLYDIQWNRALQTRSSEEHEALVAQFNQRVQRAVRVLAPGFLKEAGIAAKANSAQRHEALGAAAAAGKAPQSGGAPRQQSITPDTRQYASQGERRDAMIDDLLGVKKRGV